MKIKSALMFGVFLLGGASLAQAKNNDPAKHDSSHPENSSASGASSSETSGNSTSSGVSGTSDSSTTGASGAASQSSPSATTDSTPSNSGSAGASGSSETSKSKSWKNIPHATIKFDSGSAMLSASNKNELRKIVSDAKEQGVEIKQVTVAAWSDKQLPKRDQKLSDADKELAEKRANAVSDFLKSEVNVTDVDTYNMAETSNWIARTFNTKEAELKSVFGKKGSEAPVSNSEFKLIKKEGGPSQAVVVTELDQESQSQNQ